MPIKIQSENVLKNFKEGFIGVDGANKKLKQALIGINGVNKVLWEGIYVAQDSDFVEVNGRWVYRGAQLEVEIPTHINGELVTSTYGMFAGASGYQATPVTKVVLKHSNVTNMSFMFYNSSATSLDLSNFDTSNVTNMNSMFNSSKATTLDLSSFDTSNVTSMDAMFGSSSATTGYARTQADADNLMQHQVSRQD